MTDDLNAGFTGTPAEPATGARKIAKTATDVVKRETTAVAAGAAEHPRTATTLVLGVSVIAFAIGYVLGRNSVYDSDRYWR